jgi:hypothetical protein
MSVSQHSARTPRALTEPTCGVVVASRPKERRFRRIRDIPVAGAVQVLWSKYRWYCVNPGCARLSFFESTAQVRAVPVPRSGRAVSETSAVFGVSCPGGCVNANRK